MSDDALASLLGRCRAQVLFQLDRPAFYLVLAQRMGVGSGSVSEHLAVLRRAGLVMRRREGAFGERRRHRKEATTCAYRTNQGSELLIHRSQCPAGGMLRLTRNRLSGS